MAVVTAAVVRPAASWKRHVPYVAFAALAIRAGSRKPLVHDAEPVTHVAAEMGAKATAMTCPLVFLEVVA